MKLTTFLSIVIVLLAVSQSLFSQAAVGRILGGIFDSSGGSVSGAKVTITDVARGTTRTLTTDSAGEYSAPSLLSGTYTVRAEAQGFQSVERSNIVLGVAQDIRIDLTLSPGAQTQTVTVTEDVPAIDTTSSTLGGTITNTSIVELPLISRDFLQLLQLRPGVVDTPGGGGTGGSATNGRRAGTDVIVVEGVTQFDLATSNALINGSNKGGGNSSLPLDSVQEFSTTQNSPAEYGWRDGSAVNLGIKSGTNAIHGSAYAFGRDAKATDARSYIPTQANGTAPLSNLTLVQPGFTVGGPIIKNKLFWFASAEFARQSSISTNSVATPTVVPGLGAGSSLVDACNAVGASKVNPLSAQIAGIIPGTCTVKRGDLTTFENMFPYNTTGSVNVFSYPVSNSPSNNGLAKIDYSPNEKHHLSGFVYFARQTATGPSALQPDSIPSPYWGGPGVGSTSEYAGSWTYAPNSRWVNDLRGGAAPNSGNSATGDLAFSSPKPFGAGGYSVNSGVPDGVNNGFMCLRISGVFGSGSGNGLGNCGKNGIRGPQYQLDFSDKVSYLAGNHSFKFGYEEVFVHFNDGSTANTQGQVVFDTLSTFLTGTVSTKTNGSITIGDNTRSYRERWHAAFVQDTWRISKTVTLTPGLRWEYIGSPHDTRNFLGTFDPTVAGGLVQVGPGLPQDTLIHPQKNNFNPRIGVAWDIFGKGKTVLRAGFGSLSSFPAILAVSGSGVPFAATMCNGAGTFSSCTNPANIVVNNYGNPLQTAFPTILSLPAAAVTWTGSSCTDPTHTATCTGPSIFPTTSAISATAGPTCSVTLPCSPFVSDRNLKNPRSLQWNLDLQRAITNSLTLDVAYVGVHGYNEQRSVDLNEPAVGVGYNTVWTTADRTAYNTGKSASSQVPAGIVGQTTAQFCAANYATVSNSCVPDAPAIAAARPYASMPWLGYIIQTQAGYHSNYNGLQVTLDARNFHGLHFLTAYTYSHALDNWTKSSQNTAASVDPSNPNYQYGSSDLDTRHRLRFSPTYQIPGIKSPAQMLQGWQISAIWAYQTGFAWAPNDATSNDWAGNGENANPIASPNTGVWQTWNYTGPKNAFSAVGSTPIPCIGAATGCVPLASAPAATLQMCQAAAQAPYTNPQQQQLALAAMASSKGACYYQDGGILTPPAYGTLGNAGRGLFHGPRYQNWDISLAKLWQVKERYSAQFRIECYNCMNHINYAQFSDGASDPSAGGNVVGNSASKAFGYHSTTQGSMRQFQLGLKITF